MKGIALNSSPRMHEGNTARILDPFLRGMKEAGCEVEQFSVRKLTINPCLGCFNCWLRKPGECCQRDDMDMLYPKLREADILTLATPLYVDGMTGTLKNLLDRLVPGAEPFIELREDHCRHPKRAGTNIGKVVLVSNCGFWEMDNFGPLVAHVEAICRNMGAEFAGALLRPHGEAMRGMIAAGIPLNDVFDAARDAGRQLVREGRIMPETLRAVSRELLPREQYLEHANRSFREHLEKRA
jgi:multimeric flavodoxin WrbA